MKLAMWFIVGALVCLSAMSLFGQNPDWKVGDKIEIKNLSKEWVPGTVIGLDTWNGQRIYRVKLDDDNAPNVYFNHTVPEDIRARPVQAANGGRDAVAGGGIKAGGVMQPGAVAFKVGDTVDAYFNPKEGDRGVITEVGDRRYKIRFRQCGEQFQNWFDAPQVHPPAGISSKDPQLSYLVGRWATTTVAVGGNYAMWGRSPGIEINADGSYTWYEYASKPPVKGTWKADAKVPGATIGTQKFDGLLVNDAAGLIWKVFKWQTQDGKDHVEIDRLCSGLSEIGVRVR